MGREKIKLGVRKLGIYSLTPPLTQDHICACVKWGGCYLCSLNYSPALIFPSPHNIFLPYVLAHRECVLAVTQAH